MLNYQRASGILMHLISLPSHFGIGDMGPYAYQFADMLYDSGQTLWQVLPLTTTSIDCGNSPYTSNSAFAGNKLLISPELLAKEGLLNEVTFKNASSCFENNFIDYLQVRRVKNELLSKAYKTYCENPADCKTEFEIFISKNSYWLDNYALYSALRETIGLPWYLWPESLRDRSPQVLREKRQNLEGMIEFEKFIQFLFFKQWISLKRYCNEKGIKIVGDLPFYVSYDSADVWSKPELFKLDVDKKPLFVSGVPPDYFSATGQLWNHPIYNWEKHNETHFEWWETRINRCLGFYDLMRIDHFRGLLAYWEIPVNEKTAVNGKWVATPSDAFFSMLKNRFPSLPFIAEDLGVITDDVRQVLDTLQLPRTYVLVFAFDGVQNNAHLPHNHKKNSVVYTGTHDTNTVRGWFNKDANQTVRNTLKNYLGKTLSESDVSWEFVKMAESSNSKFCIIPVQDLLSLGSEARLNNPASSVNNYLWKLNDKQFFNIPLSALNEITAASGRI